MESCYEIAGQVQWTWDGYNSYTEVSHTTLEEC